MNRLTADSMNFEEMFCAECPHYGEPNGCNFQPGGCDAYNFFVEAAQRLKQYEDTGLTPEEIEHRLYEQELSPEAVYAIDKYADGLIERLDTLNKSLDKKESETHGNNQ